MKWGELGRSYLQGLRKTPELIRRMPFKTRTLEDELSEALLRGNLRKSFSLFDLLMIGLGITVGSGVLTLTGEAASQFAGPAVMISYILAGTATAFAAASWGELAVEYPVAGGAYTYSMVTFGEFVAWLTVVTYLMEYVAGTALIGRYFTTYLATLANLDPDFFVVSGGGDWHLNPLAGGVILVVTLLMCFSPRQNSIFISVLTVAKLALFAAILVATFTRADPSNLHPFVLPGEGVAGIFRAMGLLIFTMVGFDAISNTSEEVKDTASLPWAMVDTVVISTVLYVFLALGLVMMLPADQLASQAGFSAAFAARGLPAMQYPIAVAALLGILVGILVGLYSMSRIVMVCARDWMMPPPLAIISPRFQTPIAAQVAVGLAGALTALLCPDSALGEISSFSEMALLFLVVNTQLVRRYMPGVKLRFTRYGTVETATPSRDSRWIKPARLDLSPRARGWLVIGHLAGISVLSVGLATAYQVGKPTHISDPTAPLCLTFAGLWFLVTLSFQLTCPLAYLPPAFHIPDWMMPWMPSLAIGMVVFGIASLPSRTFVEAAIVYAVGVAFYFLFCLPMSYIKHYQLDFENTEQMNVVDLVCVGGIWKPTAGTMARLAATQPTCSIGLDGIPSATTLTALTSPKHSYALHPPPGFYASFASSIFPAPSTPASPLASRFSDAHTLPRLPAAGLSRQAVARLAGTVSGQPVSSVDSGVSGGGEGAGVSGGGEGPGDFGGGEDVGTLNGQPPPQSPFSS